MRIERENERKQQHAISMQPLEHLPCDATDTQNVFFFVSIALFHTMTTMISSTADQIRTTENPVAATHCCT